MDKKDVRKVAKWLMELQQFDFEIIHRAGSQMQHVDALSRIFLIETPTIIQSISPGFRLVHFHNQKHFKVLLYIALR